MSSAIVIDEYRPEADYDAVTALWQRNGLTLYPNDAPEQLRRAAERNPGLFLVARDGAQVVGAVLGTEDGRNLWVNHLAVETAYRRQGLATRLLELLEARGKARGLPVMLLLVYRDNADAIGYYARHGWLAVPQTLFMVKPLKDRG